MLGVPLMAEGWEPVAKAAGFFLATFVLEDLAAISAGLLLAAGGISWTAAFIACFLGIWTGDAALYAVARFAGRGWFERSPLRRFTEKVTASENWFARRGTAILVFSRIFPGARLPTYLAAGFLRIPLSRFLLVTGTACFVWTAIILLLTQSLGERAFAALQSYKHAGLILVGAALAGYAAFQAGRRMSRKLDFRGIASRYDRWRRWEFWPPWLFYIPVGLYYLWLALKHRGATVPTAANPGMFSGGMVGESKITTLNDLFETSPEFTARAELLPRAAASQRVASLDAACTRLGISYPYILKPDLGQRGIGVKLIRARAQAEAYLRQTNAPLLAQEYVSGPREVGIFYYRFPSETRGRIFAITEKIFPSIVGDGTSTVGELIRQDPRARFLAACYLNRLGPQSAAVLARGETLKLVESGNHAQGCIFRDGMRLCTPALEERIDKISRALDGFFVGRYDIRYERDEDLRAGKNFKIVELNGAASEATSIYDERKSLIEAYRTLFRQWSIVFAIGAANRRQGVAPMSLSRLWMAWRMFCKVALTYPAAD